MSHSTTAAADRMQHEPRGKGFPSGYQSRRILGIRFFNGQAPEAVAVGLDGGLVLAPSAPVLVDMVRNGANREALLHADLAIPDSGFMVLLWNLLSREKIVRLSGLAYLKQLLEEPDLKKPGRILWVLPSAAAMKKTLDYLRTHGHPTRSRDCYLAPIYERRPVQDQALANLIAYRRPAHVIIGLGGGTQEQLGFYLRKNLPFRPGIHCIGAALGFLTGDQASIPTWADRWFLGWLIRCWSKPGRFVPRYWEARKLMPLLMEYREQAPPLLSR